MKIISLNTWMGIVHEPLMHFFAEHKDADIFCLQEVHRNAIGKGKAHPEYEVDFELYEHISELFKDTHTGYFEPTVGDHYGIAMFVKKSIAVLGHGGAPIYDNPAWTPEDKENPGGHNRRLEYVRVEHNGSPLLVVNVHGMYRVKTAHLDTPERVEQSRRICEFLASHAGPTVLVGDFNLDIRTESLAILDTGMKNLVRDYGITSTRTRFYPLDDLYADYAILTPEIHVVDFKVLPDEVSDHAALCLEIV